MPIKTIYWREDISRRVLSGQNNNIILATFVPCLTPDSNVLIDDIDFDIPLYVDYPVLLNVLFQGVFNVQINSSLVWSGQYWLLTYEHNAGGHWSNDTTFQPLEQDINTAAPVCPYPAKKVYFRADFPGNTRPVFIKEEVSGGGHLWRINLLPSSTKTGAIQIASIQKQNYFIPISVEYTGANGLAPDPIDASQIVYEAAPDKWILEIVLNGLAASDTWALTLLDGICALDYSPQDVLNERASYVVALIIE